tara:strand:+ start:2495 stop:3052 length:558 start_codon:yes stop_codon:yes gene_type:complete
MSDEASEAPKTRPILKIILLVILALVVQAAVVFGTLFAAGFFDSPADAESAITAMEESENSDNLDDIVDSDEPQGSAEGGRVYFEIKPELLTNLYNSQRLLQLKVAVMVKENDEQTLVEEIKEHAFPIRSRLLEILSEKREDQASTLGYRAVLAAELKVAMNDVLEEHLGGRHVEEIYFTEFIVQ